MPPPITPEIFEVKVRTHRRTALVELFGELDIATVQQVADAFYDLAIDPEGFSHVVLDLRGLTFMDATGIHELVRQSNHAHQNQHNLAIVRGHAFINRLLAITAVDGLLVLVESPEDLSPPRAAAVRRPNKRIPRLSEPTPSSRAAA
jgi:anti-sigma B factor antagonist